MIASVNLTGHCYHSLTVVKQSPIRTINKKIQWVCQCTCGKMTLVITQHLVSGNTKSCGCRRVKTTREQGFKNKTHGMTATPEYKAWQSMKDRCYNPDNENFHNYGGRGIIVWEEWFYFDRFFKDMGHRPGQGYSLERNDVNGNYEPGNCRWATAVEQSNNKRCNQFYTFNGKTSTVAQIAREVGLNPASIWTRLNRGLTIEEAVQGRRRIRKSIS